MHLVSKELSAEAPIREIDYDKIESVADLNNEFVIVLNNLSTLKHSLITEYDLDGSKKWSEQFEIISQNILYLGTIASNMYHRSRDQHANG